MKSSFEFEPIAVVKTAGCYKFEAPRQGVFSGEYARIEFLPGFGGAAAADLEGFERIWVIFCFHLNYGKKWKPQVRPPVTPEDRKYGLWSTRSPYRPNAIGMSCVKLEEVGENYLTVSQIDMLNDTPVLDIKPYIPEADAFPDAAAGWRDFSDSQAAECWQIGFSDEFRTKAAFLADCGEPDLINTCRVQLARNPLDRRCKRIYSLGSGEYELGCRVWRIGFFADEKNKTISVTDVRSNYSAEELLPGTADRYGDKDIHRKFLQFFNQ